MDTILIVNNSSKVRKRTNKRLHTRSKDRLECLSYYSNGKLECACCHEKEYHFLTLDHVNGGGSKHEREIGRGKLIHWLIQNDFPDGYQVLCMNCNGAKGKLGYCPHHKKRRKRTKK